MAEPDAGSDHVKEELSGVVERHGDEFVDEAIETTRSVRRSAIAIFAVVGVLFLATLVFFAVVVMNFGR